MQGIERTSVCTLQNKYIIIKSVKERGEGGEEN